MPDVTDTDRRDRAAIITLAFIRLKKHTAHHLTHIRILRLRMHKTQ